MTDNDKYTSTLGNVYTGFRIAETDDGKFEIWNEHGLVDDGFETRKAAEEYLDEVFSSIDKMNDEIMKREDGGEDGSVSEADFLAALSPEDRETFKGMIAAIRKEHGEDKQISFHPDMLKEWMSGDGEET